MNMQLFHELLLTLSKGCTHDLPTWNEKIEHDLRTLQHRQRNDSSNQSSGSGLGEDIVHLDENIILKVSRSLHAILVQIILQTSLFASMENSLDEERSATDFHDAMLLQEWDTSNCETDVHLFMLVEVLRTTQNCLRWYLLSKSAAPAIVEDSFLQPWKRRTMLELYIYLIEHLQAADHVDGARSASQTLFYTTFPAFSHDEAMNERFAFLTSEVKTMHRLLKLIVQTSSVSLLLSLIRNVHNALCTFPRQTSEAIKNARIDTSIESNKAGWVTDGTNSYELALKDLAFHILRSTEPAKFPGAENDLRAELIVEILRCCYALRLGRLVEGDDSWNHLIIMLLDLDSKLPPCYECQIATVALLMDTKPEFARRVLDRQSTFIFMLNHQTTIVLDEEIVDDRAAAALTPILAVLHRFAAADPEFMEVIRSQIFTSKVKACSNLASERKSNGVAKNMQPLDDVLKGSLQWKMIRILTWPQSIVKRLAGELLWTLSNGQQQEFIRHVGMGNAVQFLSIRGLITLPSSVHA